MVPPRNILVGIALLSIFHFKTSVAIDPATASILIQEGQRLTAPFTETASQRLHGTIFGSGRAARSSDVIIFNRSSKTFHLRRTKCSWGGFSTDMFPEDLLPEHHSTVFGIESNGFLTGVSCMIEYGDRGGSRFTVTVKNPYWSRNVVSQENSRDLNIVHIRGQGNNNQVKFIIKDVGN